VPQQGRTQGNRSSKRTRLTRDERERIIVEAAIGYFAEVGFSGQTRELARRIGVTQSLIFRYFPTKEDLVERVYQEVYLRRWNPFWETILTNRTVPLVARITTFYLDYAKTFSDYRWIRIFMFSGLLGDTISRKYAALFRDRILIPMCHEIRHEVGLKKIADTDLTTEEIQICWAINSAIAMLAIREFIFDLPTSRDHSTIVPAIVHSF
jgi:AcrR family transcriptional regulator